MSVGETKNVVSAERKWKKLTEYVVHRMVPRWLFDYTVRVLNPRQVSSGRTVCRHSKCADGIPIMTGRLSASPATPFAALYFSDGTAGCFQNPPGSRSFSLSPIRRMRGLGRGGLLFTPLSSILQKRSRRDYRNLSGIEVGDGAMRRPRRVQWRNVR